MLAMLREHGPVIEADLQRYYGIDLLDFWRGTLSLRKLCVLIEHLPIDSRAARELADVDEAVIDWSLTDALLGRLIDEVAAHRWQWESMHVKRGQRRAAPKSVLPQSSSGAKVIPLVAPHELGRYLEGSVEHGD